MLEVTNATVSLLKELLQRGPGPWSGVRIQPGHTLGGDPLITFLPVNRPRHGDIKTMAVGLDVFLAAELTETLALSVLDVAPPGQADRLVLRAQADQL
jgi:hypothetical protein